MKKTSLIFAILIILLLPLAVAAQGTATTSTGFSDICSRDAGIASCIQQIYTFSLGLAALLALVMLVIAGYRYMTAGGNADTTSKAKEGITAALIGLVIIFTAVILLYLINPDLVRFQDPKNILKLKEIELFDPDTDPVPPPDIGKTFKEPGDTTNGNENGGNNGGNEEENGGNTGGNGGGDNGGGSITDRELVIYTPTGNGTSPSNPIRASRASFTCRVDGVECENLSGAFRWDIFPRAQMFGSDIFRVSYVISADFTEPTLVNVQLDSTYGFEAKNFWVEYFHPSGE